MLNPQSHEGGAGAKGSSSASLTLALYDLRRSVKKLVQSEIVLARVELNCALAELSRVIAQKIVAVVLLILSALSFLAFTIIGLGEIFGGNFWLSALLISMVMGLVSGGIIFQRRHKT